MLRDVVLTDIRGQIQFLIDVLNQSTEPLNLRDDKGNSLAILITPNEYRNWQNSRALAFARMERNVEKVDQQLQAEGLSQEDLQNLIDEECEAYEKEPRAN
jgi:PHD/YefM family antitoxin component YafN of YafNO toxin-antitoxin module